MHDAVWNGVRGVLAKKLGVTTAVNSDTHILRDLAFDSVKQLTLVVELENHFRISFEPGAAEGVLTLGDVVQLIEGRLSAEGRLDA